jgi:hypothetical protein
MWWVYKLSLSFTLLVVMVVVLSTTSGDQHYLVINYGLQTTTPSGFETGGNGW